jgi:hypothetical protein
MTLTKLQLKPGIQKQTSDLGAGGGYTDCDNIRFRYGLPEKIGGWTKTTDNTLIGVVRDAHHWVALDGTRLAALIFLAQQDYQARVLQQVTLIIILKFNL